MHFINCLQTPFGPVQVAYTGGGHACVMTTSDTGPIEVRAGSPLTLNLHIYRDEAGQFVPKDPAEMILSKYNWTDFNKRDAAPTYREKVLNTLPPIVTEFLSAHPAECASEDVEDLQRQIRYTQKDIAEAEAKLSPLKENLSRLEGLLREAKV
jgi:hypothetical protein